MNESLLDRLKHFFTDTTSVPHGRTTYRSGEGRVPDDAETAIAKLRLQLADQHTETLQVLGRIRDLLEPPHS